MMNRLMKQSLAAAVCVVGAGGALGQQAVTLDLDAASAGTNRFDIAVSGLGAADDASTDFSGSVDALLNLTFDAGNNATTTGLELTGAALAATTASACGWVASISNMTAPSRSSRGLPGASATPGHEAHPQAVG